MRFLLQRAGGALACASLCLGLAAAPSRAADAPVAASGLVPVEHFFRNPAMSDAALSPSGQRLAVLLPGPRDRLVLGVIELEGGARPRVVAAFSDDDVRSFRWVNDRRLVFDTVDLNAGSGGQRGTAGLFAVNADGSGFRPLVRRHYPGNRTDSRIESRELDPNHTLKRTLDDGSDDVIVQRYTYDALGEPLGVSLLRLNTVTGATTGLTLGAPDGARNWVVDAQGRPRVVTALQGDRVRTYLRDADQWALLEDRRWLQEGMWPLAVDASGNLLVLDQRGDDAATTALYRYDVRAKRRDEQPLLAVKGFDVGGPLELTGQHALVGARFVSDARGMVWFDPHWRSVQERIDKLLQATTNDFSCGRCDATVARVLVRSASDRQPLVYHLFDVKAGTLERVGAAFPWLKADTMAERSFVRIRARDGLEIPAYVTQPKGKGPWPTVVLVHGGPYVRGGSWEWSATPQFLASRGYVVVEPEFRGSAGFGDRHFRASFKQWGRAMQDDIADATLWAAKQGLSDPSRVCVMGSNYGGYAALMGLVRHSELYRCAVEFAAVTDIDLMYTLVRSETAEAYKRHGMPTLIGDREKDAAQLAETSPLRQATRIRKPVFMAHGGSDRSVPIEHGTRLRDAVKPHNPDLEWVEYPEEGRGLRLTSNRVDFWTRVEKFLARHLGTPEGAKLAGGS